MSTHMLYKYTHVRASQIEATRTFQSPDNMHSRAPFAEASTAIGMI